MYGAIKPSLQRRTAIAGELAAAKTAEERAFERLEGPRLGQDEERPLSKPSAVFGNGRLVNVFHLR